MAAVYPDAAPNRAGYTRRAMALVFGVPHLDDVALSCDGFIASLREPVRELEGIWASARL
jgi:LmbE family N-acetylglucosaminyl deacetylase